MPKLNFGICNLPRQYNKIDYGERGPKQLKHFHSNQNVVFALDPSYNTLYGYTVLLGLNPTPKKPWYSALNW